MTNLYRPRLKEHMEYCAEHPEELDKMAKIKSQVAEVKGVMMDNIEQVCTFEPQYKAIGFLICYSITIFEVF